MDAKKMFLALVLIATFAVIPSFATFERDFIGAEAVQTILKETAPHLKEDVMNAIIKTKTVVSNPVIEEALLKNSNGLKGAYCEETCVITGCFLSTGCTCARNRLCYRNSLDI